MRKLIAVIIVLVILFGAAKYVGLDVYFKEYFSKEEVNVTVILQETNDENKQSEGVQRVMKYIITESAEYNIKEKPEKFDKSDYIRENPYLITVEGKEYVYKPSIGVLAKTEYGKTTYAQLEGLDKAILKIFIY